MRDGSLCLPLLLLELGGFIYAAACVWVMRAEGVDCGRHSKLVLSAAIIFFPDVEAGKLLYYIPKAPLWPVFCE